MTIQSLFRAGLFQAGFCSGWIDRLTAMLGSDPTVNYTE
jgi:hypothetical protein